MNKKKDIEKSPIEDEPVDDREIKRGKKRVKNMRRRQSLMLCLLAFFLVAFIVLWMELGIPETKKLLNKIQLQEVGKEQKDAIESIYTLAPHIELEKKKWDMHIYLPVYEVLDLEKMLYFQDIFNMTLDKDTENEIYFSREQEALILSRYIQKILYKKEAITGLETGAKKDVFESAFKKELLTIAAAFMKSKDLKTGDIISMIEKKDMDVFEVYFIETLDGFENWAFPTKCIINKNGEILRVEHFYFEYEKIASCTILSKEEAYYNLPIQPEKKLYIEEIKLLYIIEDSILQPVYHFFTSNDAAEKEIIQVMAAVFQ